MIILWLSACDPTPAEDKASTDTTDGVTDGVTDTTTDTDTTDTTDTTATTGDTGSPTTAIAYFEPYYVYFTAYFGYDPNTNAARWYWADGNSVSPVIVATLYDIGFLFDPDYATNACGFTIIDADTTSFIAGAPWTVTQDGAEAEHLGFVMAPGSFTVGDYTDAETGMPSCRAVAFDPARYGNGFAEWASAREWGFGLGPLSPVVQDALENDSSYASLLALLEAGVLIGGSIQTGADARTGELLVVGYPMDNSGNLDSATSLTAEQMWPAPTQGVYTAFLANWIRADALFADP